MSVMAAEAAAGSGASTAAASEAGGAAAGTRAASPKSTGYRRGQHSGANRGRAKRRTSGPKRATSGAPEKAAPTSSRPKQRPESPADDEAARTWRQRTQEAPPPTASLPSGSGSTYRRIILAEFAACVVLVGASPFLKPRSSTETPAEAAAALALSAPMVRLTAVCLTFFILALLANGPRSGKIAAAFGGLVTVGTLVNATDSAKGLTAVFSSQPSSVGGATGVTLGQALGDSSVGASTGTSLAQGSGASVGGSTGTTVGQALGGSVGGSTGLTLGQALA